MVFVSDDVLLQHGAHDAIVRALVEPWTLSYACSAF